MAKFVYLYTKNDQFSWTSARKKISEILSVSGIETTFQHNRSEMLWHNGSQNLETGEFSITTGSFSNDPNQFTFDLRVSDQYIEISSDLVSSRTVWYYTDDTMLIISSSQRAIISLVGNFSFNPQAASWMLTTGCIGPGISWDKRIEHLGTCQSITFNKQDLSKKIRSRQIGENNSDLDEIFHSIFSELSIPGRTGLTLSGGWDSRVCAFFMSKYGKHFDSYSWGFSKSVENKATDAYIAKILAKELNISFSFVPIDQFKVDANTLKTFIATSEGRVDHISAFIDGLEFWKKLRTNGMESIVRADEAFGWLEVKSERDVRISLDLNHPSDYSNVVKCFEIGNLPSPIVPKNFSRRKKESIEKWRDRLYRNYRLPFILSGLHDLMLPFVEVINPLLHAKCILWAMRQSDKDRTEKKKYKGYVKNLSLRTKIATIPSIPESNEILTKPELVNEIKNTLKSHESRGILGNELVEYLVDNMNLKNPNKLESSLVRRLKNLLPFFIKKLLRTYLKNYQLGSNRLAFRAYIIVSIMHLVQKDLSRNG